MNMPDNLLASIDALCFLQDHLIPETRIHLTHDNEVPECLHERKESDDAITTWMQMLNALYMFSNEESRNDWTDMSLDGMIIDLEKSERVSTPSSDLTNPTDTRDVDADGCDDAPSKIVRKRRAQKAKWTRKKKKRTTICHDMT
tara:strand:+ start:1013 stop:1444 length:432 start_codon:yes stop_codon:yes gene_type:complete